MENRGKILIIDDELGPREAMRMILKDRYEVRTASGGREGLALLAKNKADVVILDIKMPDMDGIAVLREVKQGLSDVEVVMMTAYASLETARSALRHGALDYLIKPFDRDDVLKVVEKGLSRRADKMKSQTELEDLLVTNRQLEEEVESAKQDFARCYEGTIKALIHAIDAKDHYTFSHSQHVANLSSKIADAMGLPEKEKVRIEQASMIHDIGKIGVEEAILRKQGSLTYGEFAEIKKHPEIGARIAKAVPFLEETTQVILHHHERYDGEGFPMGKKGNEIPLAVRIVTVADAIDSMLRDRPYRKALPSDLVVNELRENSGTQFDPEIIGLILSGAVPLFDSNSPFGCFQ